MQDKFSRGKKYWNSEECNTDCCQKQRRRECKLLHSTESANLFFSNVFMLSSTLVGIFVSSWEKTQMAADFKEHWKFFFHVVMLWCCFKWRRTNNDAFPLVVTLVDDQIKWNYLGRSTLSPKWQVLHR